jgi:tRNA 2-thiouridine synthesizing protein A
LITIFATPCDLPPMAEKTFDLRGLKCPLPALRTRKALAGMRGRGYFGGCLHGVRGNRHSHPAPQTGDILKAKHSDAGATTFRIRKS